MRVNQIQNNPTFQGSVICEGGIEKVMTDISKALSDTEEQALVRQILTGDFSKSADINGLDFFVSSKSLKNGVSRLKITVQDDATHTGRKFNQFKRVLEIFQGKMKINTKKSLSSELYSLGENINAYCSELAWNTKPAPVAGLRTIDLGEDNPSATGFKKPRYLN